MGVEHDTAEEKDGAKSSPPGRRAKRILANTSFLYVRMLLVLVVSLYTARIVLRELGVVDYGIYNVVGGFVALVGFLGGALSQTSQRFLAFEMAKEGGQVRSVLSTGIIIHIAFAVIIFAVGHLAGQWAISAILNFPPSREAAVVGAFYFSLTAFSVSIVQIPFHSMIIAQERMSIFAGVSILETLIKLVIALSIPFAITDRLIHFTGLLSASSFMSLIIYIGFCRAVFRSDARQPLWQKSVATAMVGQLGWNLWGHTAAALGTHGVNLLLNLFFGPVVNAAKGIAVQVQSAVAMFIASVQTAVNPQITKSYSGNDRLHFERLVVFGAKVYAFIYFVTAVPVIFEAEYLVNLWLERPPPHAVAFTQITIATLFSNAISGTMFTAAQASGRVRAYNAILGTVSLFNIPLSWVVLRAGATPEGALYVGLTLAMLMIPIRVVLVGRIVSISSAKFVRKVFVPVAGVGGCTILFAAIPVALMEPSFSRVLVTAAATVLTLFSSVVLLGMSQDERKMSFAVLNIVRSRFKFLCGSL